MLLRCDETASKIPEQVAEQNRKRLVGVAQPELTFILPFVAKDPHTKM